LSQQQLAQFRGRHVQVGLAHQPLQRLPIGLLVENDRHPATVPDVGWPEVTCGIDGDQLLLHARLLWEPHRAMLGHVLAFVADGESGRPSGVRAAPGWWSPWLAELVPFPAIQQGAPCEGRAWAAGKDRQIFRSFSTRAACWAVRIRTGCLDMGTSCYGFCPRRRENPRRS